MIKKYTCIVLLASMSFVLHGHLLFPENIWAQSKRLNFVQPESYRELEEVFMNMWSKVDLVRAINMTATDKIDFIRHLVEELVYLYATTCRFLYIHDYNAERIESLHAIIINLRETVIEAFATIKNEQVTTLACLLDNLAHLVKRPSAKALYVNDIAAL